MSIPPSPDMRQAVMERWPAASPPSPLPPPEIAKMLKRPEDVYSITTAEKSSIQSHLAALNTYLQPAPPEWAADRISSLPYHWPAANLSQKEQDSVARDWLKALADLPAHAIEAGRDRWIRGQARKPLPANIRDLALESVADAWTGRRRCERLPRKPVEDRAAPGKVVSVEKWRGLLRRLGKGPASDTPPAARRDR